MGGSPGDSGAPPAMCFQRDLAIPPSDLRHGVPPNALDQPPASTCGSSGSQTHSDPVWVHRGRGFLDLLSSRFPTHNRPEFPPSSRRAAIAENNTFVQDLHKNSAWHS